MEQTSDENPADAGLDRTDYYLKQIDKNNALLLRISEEGLDRFIEDELVFNAGCFLLQRCLGSCINLGADIVTAHGFRKPTSNRDVFVILASENVIPPELAQRLQNAVSIRDQLVNLDPQLDVLSVFEAIRHDLASILAFEKHILSWLSPSL